jgi:hypothetical protein
MWIACTFLIAVGGVFDWASQLFQLAPLVVVPLGLGLIERHYRGPVSGAIFAAASRLQPAGAAFATLAFWFPRGELSAWFTWPWLMICLLLGLAALGTVWRRADEPEAACADVALLYLPVGAVWLLLSRLGVTPLGLSEVIVLLTAVHFHFAGFVVSVFAAKVGQALRHVFPAGFAVFCLVAGASVAGTALVAVGFLLSPLVKVTAILLYVAGLTGLLSLLTVLLPAIEHVYARRVLTFSAASLFVGVILAGVYGVSEYGGELLISIPQMARFHGAVNALGFALCGLLGWTLAGDRLTRDVAATVARGSAGFGSGNLLASGSATRSVPRAARG